jgi:AraC family transcriptional regulator of adaptative response/methylated-DNA-[protein]-cysteine methyltransferase
MHLQTARVPVPLFGAVCLAATAYGVVRVHLGDEMPRFRRELREEWPDAELRGSGPVVRAAGKAIQEYLRGGDDPKVDVVLPEDGFSVRVWRQISKIPRGETRTYGRLAKALRNPSACRAVGQACGRNPVPLVIPCHRVIASDGGLGGFSSDLAYKRRLLELEGIRL